MFTRIKTAQEIVAIRQSGQILAAVLKLVDKTVEAGMSGKDVAELAAKELKALGGRPSFLGFMGFPDVICISVNDAVVHGIPNKQEFVAGDVVGFDFGVTFNGMITDSAFTKVVGQGSGKVNRLITETERSLYKGIEQVKDGVRTGDIGAAIQKVLDKANLGIVRDLVGHGVGHEVHEDPNIPNYGPAGVGSILKKGMTIAIEPMATLGDFYVTVDKDNWTVRTLDHSLSAHFEHTVLITDDGYEILTQR